MKKYIPTIMVCILFTAGLSLLLYPFVANQWNTFRQSRLISDYDETVAGLDEAGLITYEEEWQRALDYNDSLIPYILPDSFSTAEIPEEGSEEYLACLNLTGDGMMGYVQVPKIGVKIPVYHTTGEEVLQKGAGHLPGSSIPVGGEGTHAVISAHRGLPSAALFTDLDKLTYGDYFLLSVLDDILCYQVDRISVVEPTDTSTLAAEEGQDLVTLLTCTPYGVNSHRLLVRGTRVPYNGEEEAARTPVDTMLRAVQNYYMLYLILGLSVTLLVILFMRFLFRRPGRNPS